MPYHSTIALALLNIAAIGAYAQPVAQVAQREALQPGFDMYMASKADPMLAREFARVTEPIIRSAPWVSAYGTTSPSTMEELEGRSYYVFHGCKPHECILESYTVLYDASAKRITAGAFVQNEYDGALITKSRITWLGTPDFDSVEVLGKYLY